MQQLLAIGLGGCCGALARHGFNLALKKYADFPWSTFAANMTGCLLIGIMMALILDRKFTSEAGTAFLVTGFLGSLTTFSTFSFQTIELLQANRLGAAAGNVLLNVLIGLTAVFVGMKLVRVFFPAA
ncbi:MAG: fluoride efflux transporter CrcB [Planctomycetaceae bacterium]|nr:fluoride efflux transporter CrcB [Planctomycetaceae bacterium]